MDRRWTRHLATSTTCTQPRSVGLFVEIRRTNISNLSAFVTIYEFDEGIDGGRTSLAPDVAIPSDTDLLFSDWNCLQGDGGIYEIDSVNTL